MYFNLRITHQQGDCYIKLEATEPSFGATIVFLLIDGALYQGASVLSSLGHFFSHFYTKMELENIPML